MEQLLLRPEEAAKVLGVGRSRIYRLLADGVIPGIRVGRSVRVPADALRAWGDGDVRVLVSRLGTEAVKQGHAESWSSGSRGFRVPEPGVPYYDDGRSIL